MNKVILFGLLCVVVLLQGCSVFSINPIATTENTVVEPNLVGTWQSDDMIFDVELDKGNKLYDVKSPIEKGGDLVSTYQGKAVEINGKLFFQIYPQNIEKAFGKSEGCKISPWYCFYLQPVYGFMYIKEVRENEISVACLSKDGFSKYFEKKDFAYQSVKDDRLLLTDSTEKLCLLMAELVDCNDADVWEEAIFKRIIRKVGVYDSRAVAYAYWWDSDRINQYNEPLIEQAKKAKEQGDQELFEKLDAELKEHQTLIHKQVFGGVAIDDILGDIDVELSNVVKDANLVAIISKWDEEARGRYKSAELVDVTDSIVEQFELNEKQLETVKQFKDIKLVPEKMIENGH